MHRGDLHLYGHSHGTLPGTATSTDVGVDCWDSSPVTLAQFQARFAKQSGGDIDVASVVGRGTTFTLYLPKAEMQAQETAEKPASEGADLDNADKCILVVEDNVEVGRFCTQILNDLGYGSLLTQSAEAALAEIEAVPFRFHAVFSDVVMPGMGGFELAKRLRETHPDLPVVLTSGYSHVLAQDDTHGFDLVHKPYSAGQVDVALRAAARRRQLAAAT